MAISRDRVAASGVPEDWRLPFLFTRAIFLGLYQAISSIIFFVVVYSTDFFGSHFHVRDTWDGTNDAELHALMYLQSSILGQASVFCARQLGEPTRERLPSLLLISAFILAQLIATFIGVWADWGFTRIYGFGWNWAGCVWIWDIVWFVPMYIMDFLVLRVSLRWRKWFIYDQGRHGLEKKHFFDWLHMKSDHHHHHPRHNRPGRMEVSDLTARARARAGYTAASVDKEVRKRRNSMKSMKSPMSPDGVMSPGGGLKSPSRLHGLQPLRTPGGTDIASGGGGGANVNNNRPSFDFADAKKIKQLRLEAKSETNIAAAAAGGGGYHVAAPRAAETVVDMDQAAIVVPSPAPVPPSASIHGGHGNAGAETSTDLNPDAIVVTVL